MFSGPMVRAILDGRKTVTRRVVKPQPADNFYPLDTGLYHPLRVAKSGEEYPAPQRFGAYDDQDDYPAPCAPGDRLWVCEKWAAGACADGYSPKQLHQPTWQGDNGGLWFAADDAAPASPISPRGKWRPSIFMPRWASRITLEVVSVRVERLQDITAEDAVAEGVPCWMCGGPTDGTCENECQCYHTKAAARDSFSVLWNELNAKRGYDWDADPWVWRIEFRRAQ